MLSGDMDSNSCERKIHVWSWETYNNTDATLVSLFFIATQQQDSDLHDEHNCTVYSTVSSKQLSDVLYSYRKTFCHLFVLLSLFYAYFECYCRAIGQMYDQTLTILNQSA